MKITVKNNTGYDISECSLYLYGGKKEVGWFEDGDSITISFTPFAPTLLGYIHDEYGDKVLVKSEARPLAKNDSYVVKWAFNKVHECDWAIPFSQINSKVNQNERRTIHDCPPFPFNSW